MLGAETPGPKTFTTPEQARDALIQAARTGPDAVKDIMGATALPIMVDGDDGYGDVKNVTHTGIPSNPNRGSLRLNAY